jgi:hypothetical protein
MKKMWASDKGQPQLEGVCTLSVSVKKKNVDNTQSVFFPTEPVIDQPEKSSEIVPEISETPTEQSTEQFLVEEPVVEPVVEPAVQPTGIEPEGLDPAVDPTVDPGAEAPAVEISGEVDKDFVLDNRSGAPVVQNDTKEETEITGKSFSEALITL